MRWIPDFARWWLALRLGFDAYAQINAALRWMSTVAKEEDRILIRFSTFIRIYRFGFPLRREGVLKKGDDTQRWTFVITDTPKEKDDPEWVCLFSARGFYVFENRARSTVRLLRWGLTPEEKRSGLQFARAVLTQFLREENIYDVSMPLPGIFGQRTDVDAALWVAGEFRGSIVVERQILREGILQTITYASRDPRFTPVLLEELPNCRIELTVLSPLKIPISQQAIEQNEIDATKGYHAQSRGKRGWYLPIVFNIRKFSSLRVLLNSLMREKAGMGKQEERRAKTTFFEVQDFIESNNQAAYRDLSGPILRVGDGEMERRLHAAADWLLGVQGADGSLLLYQDPFQPREHQAPADWPRMAFSAWALAEYANFSRGKNYKNGAEQAFLHIKNRVAQQPSLHSLLTFAYLGHLSVTLGNRSYAEEAAKVISERLQLEAFEPITFSQIASFFKRIKLDEYTEIREKTERMLKNQFQRTHSKKQPIQLAVWAELFNVFKDRDEETSQTVADWLIQHQRDDGSFPASANSNFTYTRGTGKIFEVLALDRERHDQSIQKALRWLYNMQYDGENTFFIREERRKEVFGGFRHDYCNPAAWIDAVGHFLLGGCRMLAMNPTKNYERS